MSYCMPPASFVTVPPRDLRGQLLLLGTGTSVGVPVVGCGCEVCTSADPRNCRSRTSVVLGLPEGTLLIDTTPDLLEQTDTTVSEIADGAVRYAGSVAKLLPPS